MWPPTRACGDLCPYPLVHGGAHGLVQVALRARQLDRMQDFALGRKLGGDLLLGTAQQKGTDAPRQAVPPRRVRVLLDRCSVEAPEGAGVTQ